MNIYSFWRVIGSYNEQTFVMQIILLIVVIWAIGLSLRKLKVGLLVQMCYLIMRNLDFRWWYYGNVESVAWLS